MLNLMNPMVQAILQAMAKQRVMTLRRRSPSDKPVHDRPRSKYWPHQGERECARRVMQMEKKEARDGWF